MHSCQKTYFRGVIRYCAMNKVKGYIYGCVSAATFGLIPLFSVPVMEKGITVDNILCYRFCIAAAAIGLLSWVKKESLRVSFKELLLLVLLGAMYTGSAFFLFWGYGHMATGIACTILYLYPVFVILLMATFFHEKVTWINLLAIFLAFCGVAMLYLGDGDQKMNLMGVIIVLAAALCYALYIVGVNKSVVQTMTGGKVSFYTLVTGAVMALVKSCFGEGMQVLPDWSSVFNVVMLAIVPTVISCVTMVYSVRYVGSTTTSVLGAVEPVTAVVVGILVFSEPFTLNLMVGILLIIIAVLLIILSDLIRATLSRVFRSKVK